MNEWISADKRMPTECDKFIAWIPGKGAVFLWNVAGAMDGVTHWMYPPTSPYDTRRWCATCGDLLYDDELPICKTCLTERGYRKETT